jgi:hypothetical protein
VARVTIIPNRRLIFHGASAGDSRARQMNHAREAQEHLDSAVTESGVKVGRLMIKNGPSKFAGLKRA